MFFRHFSISLLFSVNDNANKPISAAWTFGNILLPVNGIIRISYFTLIDGIPGGAPECATDILLNNSPHASHMGAKKQLTIVPKHFWQWLHCTIKVRMHGVSIQIWVKATVENSHAHPNAMNMLQNTA